MVAFLTYFSSLNFPTSLCLATLPNFPSFLIRQIRLSFPDPLWIICSTPLLSLNFCHSVSQRPTLLTPDFSLPTSILKEGMGKKTYSHGNVCHLLHQGSSSQQLLFILEIFIKPQASSYLMQLPILSFIVIQNMQPKQDYLMNYYYKHTTPFLISIGLSLPLLLWEKFAFKSKIYTLCLWYHFSEVTET